MAGANDRYVQVFKALADKYPSENLLLVTHGRLNIYLIHFLNLGLIIKDLEI